MNNQKQISTAMLNYESGKGEFPGWTEYLGPMQIPSSGGTVAVPVPDSNSLYHNVAWPVLLFPFIEQNELWNAWRRQTTGTVDDENNLTNTGSRPAVFLPVLACPSDVTIIKNEGSTSMSYVVNTGRIDPIVSGTQPRDVAANGVFFNHSSTVIGEEITAGVNVGEYQETMSLDRLTQLDGSTTTLMLSENIQAGDWVPRVYDTSTTPGSWTTTRQTPISEAQCGFVWSSNRWVADGTAVSGIDVTYAMNENLDGTGLSIHNARPSSRHPGVVVATFCGGNTQVLSETIDYQVYQHLMTPDGSNAQPTPLTGVLDAASF